MEPEIDERDQGTKLDHMKKEDERYVLYRTVFLDNFTRLFTRWPPQKKAQSRQ